MLVMAAIFEQCFSISLRKMQVFVCYWCCISIDHSSIQTAQMKGRAVLICCPFCLCCRTSYRLQLNEGLNFCMCMHYTVFVIVKICSSHSFISIWRKIVFWSYSWSNVEVMVLSYASQDLGLSSARWTWGLHGVIWVVGWGYLKIRDS